MEQLCTICGKTFDRSVDACPIHRTTLVLNHQRLVGRVLEDRYTIKRALYRDGYLLVLQANDQRIGQLVELKTQSVHPKRFPNRQEALEREVQVYLNVPDPAWPTVLDKGFINGNEWPFYVLEHLDGPSLEQLIHEKWERVPTESEWHELGHWALSTALAIAAPLENAHATAEEYVHGALCPAAITLDMRGEREHQHGIRLTNFGLTWRTRPSGDAPRGHTATRGAYAYTAPEQWRGEATSAQTDVYGLGLVLFELLSGKRPFDTADRRAQQDEVLSRRAPRLSERNPSIPYPEELEELVALMLERRRDDRPASMAVVARRLRRCLEAFDAGKHPAELRLIDGGADAVRTPNPEANTADSGDWSIHGDPRPQSFKRSSESSLEGDAPIVIAELEHDEMTDADPVFNSDDPFDSPVLRRLQTGAEEPLEVEPEQVLEVLDPSALAAGAVTLAGIAVAADDDSIDEPLDISLPEEEWEAAGSELETLVEAEIDVGLGLEADAAEAEQPSDAVQAEFEVSEAAATATPEMADVPPR